MEWLSSMFGSAGSSGGGGGIMSMFGGNSGGGGFGSAGGSITGLIGQLTGGGQAGKNQGEIDAINYNTQLALIQSRSAARAIKYKGRKKLGRYRASVGASGVEMQGSALDVFEEIAAVTEVNAQNKMYKGEQAKRLGDRQIRQLKNNTRVSIISNVLKIGEDLYNDSDNKEGLFADGSIFGEKLGEA